ncbi:MAG: sulfurtransferase TusA family protein [Euryarchaeota archaeon]|nr:sulfurtransferase TusA family protein [Euryarchaeota archaeon]MBT7459590.1 sulfurtransferase TusA family protein [Euryarchaeota archaeon]
MVKVVSSVDMNQNISHHLNVIGFFCPVPLAETKKALKNLKRGDVLEVVADDPESLHDISMLIERMPHSMNVINDQSGEFRFIIEVK